MKRLTTCITLPYPLLCTRLAVAVEQQVCRHGDASQVNTEVGVRQGEKRKRGSICVHIGEQRVSFTPSIEPTLDEDTGQCTAEWKVSADPLDARSKHMLSL